MNNADLKLAIRIGEELLRSGAETARVEDTMNRIIRANPKNTSNTFATPTGIFATVEDDDDNSHTIIRRVDKISLNLNKIDKLNDLSRQYTSGQIDFIEVNRKLVTIKHETIYSDNVKMFSNGISCFSFSYMLGQNFTDAIGAFFVGLLSIYLYNKLFKRSTSTFIDILFISIGIGFLSIIYTKISPANSVDNIIIGAIMPLVPGIETINAVRDVVVGDFQSASSRLLNAFLTAVSLACGIGFSLSLWVNYFGGAMQ